MGALIEGIMESTADWYSQNLATEVAKCKMERSNQGKHNNQASFGMKKNADKILILDIDELPGLLPAFESYATDNHSDMDIAHLLTKDGYRVRQAAPSLKTPSGAYYKTRHI